MRVFHWEQLCGSSLNGQIELAELVASGAKAALFSGFEQTATGRVEVFVQTFDASDPAEAEQIANRFQEAKFLQHPNLLRIGKIGRDETAGLLYICSLRPDSTLTQFIGNRGLKAREVREFTSQLVSALSYLHAENLVFCNLRTNAVWKFGTAWLLADFSQMRLASTVDRKELRPALTRQTDLPPEAYEGVVTSAWDCWGLGLLIRAVMTPETLNSPESLVQRARQLRDVELPPPFDTITRDCLQPDPELRIKLDEINARLAGAGTALGLPIPNGGLPAIATFSSTDNDLEFAEIPLGTKSPVRLWGLVALALAVLLAILWAGGAFGRLAAPPLASGSNSASIPISEADRTVTEPASERGQSETQMVVNRWAAATKFRDAKALAALYTPTVKVYYDQRSLARDQLQRNKEKEFRSVTQVAQYELSHPEFHKLNNSMAVMILDRAWRFGGPEWSSGADRVQLTFELMDGAWKISAERELKSYWLRRAHER